MKFVTMLLSALVFMASCATTETSQQSAKKVDLLILSPQGVAPAADTVGFNKLVSNVTQAFSKELVPVLESKSISNINVLDQNPKYDSGQKLATYSVKHGAPSVIILMIETETRGKDERMLLHVQYVQQEFLEEKGSIKGVKAKSVLDKSYFLRGSVSGDSTETVTDLVEDYVKFLKTNNRIK